MTGVTVPQSEERRIKDFFRRLPIHEAKRMLGKLSSEVGKREKSELLPIAKKLKRGDWIEFYEYLHGDKLQGRVLKVWSAISNGPFIKVKIPGAREVNEYIHFGKLIRKLDVADGTMPVLPPAG